MPRGPRQYRLTARQAAAAVPVVIGLLAVALVAPAHADPVPGRSAVLGSRPDFAKPTADRGAVPDQSTVTARIYLASRAPAALAAFDAAVSDPNSSRHGQFLSPGQFQSRFGADPQQTSRLAQWLTGTGLSVTAHTAHYLAVAGTAAAIRTAFHTSLHRYATPQGVQQAPDGDLTVPADLAPTVLAVSGISAPAAARPAGGPSTAARSTQRTGTQGTGTQWTGTQSVCSPSYGQQVATGFPTAYTATTPYTPCPYIPSQLRRAYGVTGSGLSGRGVTIAIVDAYGSPTMLADADHFAARHGDQPFRAGQYAEHVTPQQWHVSPACAPPGSWAGEESLDVEMAHGLAPGANVLYVGANSCLNDDLMDAEASIIDSRRADVVSNSWDEIMHADPAYLTPGIVNAWELLFEEGVAEGIGIYVAAGDCGDSSPGAALTGVNCDRATTRAQADYPSSSPWVTSVGATALALGKDGGAAWETSAGDRLSVLSADATAWQPFPGAFYFGGGGGTSEDFDQPWYQWGTVPSSLSHSLLTGARSSIARRVTPDVAMDGDAALSTLVGFTSGGSYREVGYGGTSVSAPAFAGIQADAQQAAGHPIGFANPDLYLRNAFGVFHDVLDHPKVVGGALLSDILDLGPDASGAPQVLLFALGQDYGLHAGHGYDNATGLGSPTADYLRSYRWWLDHRNSSPDAGITLGAGNLTHE
ncbi:subtilase family serine protease [Streptacidiphilus sp. MAP12-16]|uniref:S53 family peptidase n=1 Tax=Streptacidiphilus sp. MAP12-16 TaxID=3156300 RepID=UPI0035115125